MSIEGKEEEENRKRNGWIQLNMRAVGVCAEDVKNRGKRRFGTKLANLKHLGGR